VIREWLARSIGSKESLQKTVCVAISVLKIGSDAHLSRINSASSLIFALNDCFVNVFQRFSELIYNLYLLNKQSGFFHNYQHSNF